MAVAFGGVSLMSCRYIFYEPEKPEDLDKLVSISVPVTSPCDQSWRKKYPDNWMWQANRAITRADDELTNRYGIYY